MTQRLPIVLLFALLFTAAGMPAQAQQFRPAPEQNQVRTAPQAQYEQQIIPASGSLQNPHPFQPSPATRANGANKTAADTNFVADSVLNVNYFAAERGNPQLDNNIGLRLGQALIENTNQNFTDNGSRLAAWQYVEAPFFVNADSTLRSIPENYIINSVTYSYSYFNGSNDADSIITTLRNLSFQPVDTDDDGVSDTIQPRIDTANPIISSDTLFKFSSNSTQFDWPNNQPSNVIFNPPWTLQRTVTFNDTVTFDDNDPGDEAGFAVRISFRGAAQDSFGLITATYRDTINGTPQNVEAQTPASRITVVFNQQLINIPIRDFYISTTPQGDTVTSGFQHWLGDLQGNLPGNTQKIGFNVRTTTLDTMIVPDSNVTSREIAEESPFQEIKFYPNPIRMGDELNLKVDFKLNATQPVSYKLYNTTGQVIRENSYSNVSKHGRHELRIPTEGISPGLYVATVQAGGHTKTARILIQ